MKELEANLKKKHRDNMHQTIEEHNRQIQEINEFTKKNMEALQNELHELEKRYRELAIKYQNRESRPEDLERIDMLQASLLKKEQLLETTIVIFY